MTTGPMQKCPSCGAEIYCVGRLVFCPKCKQPWHLYARVKALPSRAPKVTEATEPDGGAFFGDLRNKLRGG